jgi:hypothetical protein
MKELVRRICRFLWRLAGPVLRPISRKASALIQRSAEQAIRDSVQPPLGELLVGVSIARREVGTYRNETNLLLDSLVREVTRLQDEVASLRAELAASDLPATLPINATAATGRDLAESA